MKEFFFTLNIHRKIKDKMILVPKAFNSCYEYILPVIGLLLDHTLPSLNSN